MRKRALLSLLGLGLTLLDAGSSGTPLVGRSSGPSFLAKHVHSSYRDGAEHRPTGFPQQELSNGHKPVRLAGNAAPEMRAAAEAVGGNKPVASGLVRHAGMAAKVSVSSTSRATEGEGAPEALIDGDLATRWSSEYAEPQHVELHFGEDLKIERIRLHWEQAGASRYALSLSADGETWKPVHLHFSPNAKPEDRVDDIAVKEMMARAIRLEMLARINTNWGFSLYEIEIVAAD